MKKEKPFEMSNATYIPNQLFDNRCKFLTGQQKIFLIYLYRRLWGYGETEIKLSYSVVFEDFPCIIKNKQKFSDMISDLAKKGLINIVRGHKKCHTYIINEENYKNLLYWGERTKNKDFDDIQNDIENGIPENKIIDTDFSNIDLDDNTLETLIKVYQYEYKKLYPKSKNIICDKLDFDALQYELNEIENINYSTFIRCYYLKDFYNDKPKVDRIYTDGINNYNKYKDIVKLTPLDNADMLRVFKNVCDSILFIDGKTIEKCFDCGGVYKMERDAYYYQIVICSKTFKEKSNNRYTEKQIEIIKDIKKYPAIVDYVNGFLKKDSIFNENIETLNTGKVNEKPIVEQKEKQKKENEEIERFNKEADADLLSCLSQF